MAEHAAQDHPRWRQRAHRPARRHRPFEIIIALGVLRLAQLQTELKATR